MNTVTSRLRGTAIALVFAALLAGPLVFGWTEFRMIQFEQVLSFMIVVIALNVAMGYAGQFVAGIPAVFAVGAYSAALAVTHVPELRSFLAICVVGGVSAGLAGLLLGLPALRVEGFYLALTTLYCTLVVPAVARQWDLFGGAAGLPLFIVPDYMPKLAGYPLYVVALAMVALTAIGSLALERSRTGRGFMALNASSELATSIGLSIYRTKLLAVVIASGLAGIAGGLYVYTQQFFSPQSVSPALAILMLAAMVIGGEGSILGALIGGALVMSVNTFLTGFEEYNTAIFGVILIVFSVAFPKGLASRILHWARGRRRRRTAKHEPLTMDALPLALAENRSTVENEVDATWRPDNWSEAALRADGVRKAFGGVSAVKDVSLVVSPGRIHGLVGSNGSGKTTLLNLISGFYRMDAGDITMGEQHLARSADAIARSGVARTFQSPKLIVDATVIENLVLVAERRIPSSGLESFLRLPRGRRALDIGRRDAHEVLAWLGIDHLADVEVSALPHGTRRLVEVARAILARPRFILMDEPAAGLSPRELDVLVATLERVKKAGVGVLLIEHNLPLVLEIADHITVLHQGATLFSGTPEEMTRDEAVSGAFLGLETVEAVD